MQILTPEPDSALALHKEAQRLRWLFGAFEHQQHVTEQETGFTYRTDRHDLASAFSDWLKDFEAQKPADSRSNAAYVGFAAGLMLRALIRHTPASVHARPKSVHENDPAHFWPEGYLYVAFCLSVRGQVLRSDYGERQHQSGKLSDLRTWWSFKENTSEDPSLAIGFLDLFAGCEPVWDFPQIFRARPTFRLATGQPDQTGGHLR